MKTKEIRCTLIRENKNCNQKLFEYEGDLSQSIIYSFCRKCKKTIKVFNEIIEL
jgi:hypothetical protein